MASSGGVTGIWIAAAYQPAGLVSPEVFGVVLGFVAAFGLAGFAADASVAAGFAAASGLALAWRTAC